MCIQCTDLNKNYLLFLSCTNYSWQIKKCMTVEHKIITAKWLSDNSIQFITIDGIYYFLNLTETLCTSGPGTLDWVAVIDNCEHFFPHLKYFSNNHYFFQFQFY